MLKKILSATLALILLVGASMSLDVMAQNEKAEALKAQLIEDSVYTSTLSFPEGYDEVAAKIALAEAHPYTGAPLTEEEKAEQEARFSEIVADNSLTEAERDAALAEIHIFELKVPEDTSATVAAAPTKNDITLNKPKVYYESSSGQYWIDVTWQWKNNNCLETLYAEFGKRFPGYTVKDGTPDQVAICFASLSNASKVERKGGTIKYYAGQKFNAIGEAEGQYKNTKVPTSAKTSTTLSVNSPSAAGAIYEFNDYSEVVYQKDQGEGKDRGNVWPENYTIVYWGWKGTLTVKFSSNFKYVSGEVSAYFLHNYKDCVVEMTGIAPITSGSNNMISYQPTYSVTNKVEEAVRYTENTQIKNGVS